MIMLDNFAYLIDLVTEKDRSAQRSTQISIVP